MSQFFDEPDEDLYAEGGRRTKDEAVFRHLYAAIVGQHLEPGIKLPEDTLAEAYGVSRTSIRKALQKLAHKGLVDVRVNHGASVAQPTLKDARDLFASRRILECGVIELVAGRATPEQLLQLEELVDQETEATGQGDWRQAIYLSGQFHLALARLADNEIISGYLADLVARTSLVIATFGSPQFHCGCPPSRHIHIEVLSLLRRGEASAAREWMDAHLKAVEHSVVQEKHSDTSFDLKAILSQVDPDGYRSLTQKEPLAADKKRRK
ncbi:GntR family transcriptional regulator [uncultured Castellaniella sp.]|uniref:GntR family transcriptional regulator n=1 Tax=uncultured Castellaniella sp. TaxID=647907 RepID=UPI00262624AE|nr:GntR family transcriptional regulator [uncultured Castellaniella sp.]